MLSGKTKLCIKVLVAMASAPAGRPVTVGTLAERLQVSVSHMESVVGALREGGFIRSARGPGGGYFLDCDTDRVSVWAVVRRLDPRFGDKVAPIDPASSIAALEQSILDTFIGYLSSRTIGEFADPGSWPQDADIPMGSRFRLRPMPQLTRPTAPNSVFQLSAFPRLGMA
jgi:Rrf2 family protein